MQQAAPATQHAPAAAAKMLEDARSAAPAVTTFKNLVFITNPRKNKNKNQLRNTYNFGGFQICPRSTDVSINKNKVLPAAGLCN